MELLQLKYFKDAAEMENFSKAAIKNMVPQPSISNAVKRLEEELDVKLFDRVGKKIFLNEEGRYLLEKATDILNSVDESTLHFENLQKCVINLYVQDAPFFQPHYLVDFRYTHPSIYIDNVFVDEVLHSSRIPYDFTFMIPVEDMSKFEYEEIFEDDFVAIVSEKNPLSKKDTINISELKDEKFVGVYGTIPTATLSTKYCEKYGGFTPIYVFQSHDNLATAYAVSKNIGVSIVPRKHYLTHPYNGVKILNFDEKYPSPLVIAWEKNKVLSPAEKEFLKFIRKWFKSLQNNDI